MSSKKVQKKLKKKSYKKMKGGMFPFGKSYQQQQPIKSILPPIATPPPMPPTDPTPVSPFTQPGNKYGGKKHRKTQKKRKM